MPFLVVNKHFSIYLPNLRPHFSHLSTEIIQAWTNKNGHQSAYSRIDTTYFTKNDWSYVFHNIYPKIIDQLVTVKMKEVRSLKQYLLFKYGEKHVHWRSFEEKLVRDNEHSWSVPQLSLFGSSVLLVHSGTVPYLLVALPVAVLLLDWNWVNRELFRSWLFQHSVVEL